MLEDEVNKGHIGILSDALQNNEMQLLGNPSSEQVQTGKSFHSFAIWLITTVSSPCEKYAHCNTMFSISILC